MPGLTQMQIKIEEAKLETEYAYRKAARETARLRTLMRHTGDYFTHFAEWKAQTNTLLLLEGKLEFIGYPRQRRYSIRASESLQGQLVAIAELTAETPEVVVVGEVS